MNRRDFLQASARSIAAVIGGSQAADLPLTRELLNPCPPERWRKRGVILKGTEPWEDDNVQNFTTRAEPLDGDRWRLWYSVSGAASKYTIAYAEGIPGEPMTKVPAALSPGKPADAPFSIGLLPDKWRPVQGVHMRLANGRHRLYFWAHGPQVARYLAAESEDGRRYRVLDPLRPILYHPNDRAAYGIRSPDGVLYRTEPGQNLPVGENPARPELISNDATNVYQLPDGSFEIYSTALLRVPKSDPAYIAEDNAPGLLRVIDRYTSEDGLHFENRRRVIQRDADDPVDQQFYYLAVTHTPRGRVGMLGHYRCRAQTMDLEWCFSQNGLEWQRPFRKAWLPRNEASAPDSYGIYAGSQLVHHGGRWNLFYTGVNSSHNGRQAQGPPRQVVMLATADSLWA